MNPKIHWVNNAFFFNFYFLFLLEMMEVISVKLQTENLFLLKAKIKQKQACRNKEYNIAFKDFN